MDSLRSAIISLLRRWLTSPENSVASLPRLLTRGRSSIWGTLDAEPVLASGLHVDHNECEEEIHARNEEDGGRGSWSLGNAGSRDSGIDAGAVAAGKADRDWSPWRSGEAGVVLHAALQGHD